MRDLDIDMFYDAEKKEYYCLRCCYTGTEEDVQIKNQMARFRYRAMHKRFGHFDGRKDRTIWTILVCTEKRLLSWLSNIWGLSYTTQDHSKNGKS